MTSLALVYFNMDSNTAAGDRDTIYHLKKGFEKIGVDVDIYFAFKNKQNKKLNKYFDVVFGQEEYYICNWSSRTSLLNLNKYDYIVFNCLAPHGTPKNPPASGWEKLWTETQPEKFVVISDPYWRKFYYHGIKIAKYVSGVICQNRPALREMKTFPSLKAFIKLPYDTDVFRPYDYDEKENIIVSFTFWKSWKNHKYLLLALKEHGEEILKVVKEIRLFGDGIELRKMKSPDPKIRAEYGYYDLWFETKKYFYYGGFVSNEEKAKELTRSRYALDLSWSELWNGNVTYSLLDAYAFGNVVIGSSEHFEFPKDAIIDVGNPKRPYNIYKAIMQIKDIDKKKFHEMVEKGREFIREEHDAKKIAKQILYFMENKDTDGSFPIYKKMDLFSFFKN